MSRTDSRRFTVYVNEASDHTGDSYALLRDSGLNVIVGRAGWDNPGRAMTEDEMIEAARDADALLGVSRDRYTRRVMEECNFFWYEEPMREFNLGAYAQLADQLTVPVLAAETSDGVHWNAATWIDMKALDMVRTSSFYKGGITGALKIAHLAESHGIRAQVHGMGLANAHIAAAIPNNDFYEQLVFSSAHIASLRQMPELPIVDGWITAPATPGLSGEMDWDRIEKTALAVV